MRSQAEFRIATTVLMIGRKVLERRKQKSINMSKTEVLHELYHLCNEINFHDSHEIISSAESEEEADFFRTVTDFVLQQKQKRVIAEKRF